MLFSKEGRDVIKVGISEILKTKKDMFEVQKIHNLDPQFFSEWVEPGIRA